MKHILLIGIATFVLNGCVTMVAMAGCGYFVFGPLTKRNSASAISSMLFVIAPAPNDLTRPYTVGACQVAAHEWTLLFPTTPRASFWRR